MEDAERKKLIEQHRKEIYKLEKQQKAPKKKILNREFAKYMVLFVMLTYFIGIFIGVFVVLEIIHEYPDSSVQALIALLSYIGAPVVTAIGFYCWKAKAENVIKFSQQNGIKDPSEVLNHITQSGGM